MNNFRERRSLVHHLAIISFIVALRKCLKICDKTRVAPFDGKYMQSGKIKLVLYLTVSQPITCSTFLRACHLLLLPNIT